MAKLIILNGQPEPVMSGVNASWKNVAGRFIESGQRTGGLIGTLNCENWSPD
jgi:hypothetical protein